AVSPMVGMSRYPEPATARYPLATSPNSENWKNRSTETAALDSERAIILYSIGNGYGERTNRSGSARYGQDRRVAPVDRRHRAARGRHHFGGDSGQLAEPGPHVLRGGVAGERGSAVGRP